MSGDAAALQLKSWLQPKYLLFGFIGLMLAYVLVHDERFLIDARDPEWQHIHSFRWWLLPHGLTGACALLLGPMQFSDRLRQRFTKLHRVLGRFYVGGVFLAAPLGFYVQYFEAQHMGAPGSFSVAAAAQAILWMLTTAIALAFILKRKTQQHRQWMTRSFAVALVFLEVRVVLGVFHWDNLGYGISEAVVWGCNVFAIFLADVVLQFQELRRARPAAAKSRAATAEVVLEAAPGD